MEWTGSHSRLCYSDRRSCEAIRVHQSAQLQRNPNGLIHDTSFFLFGSWPAMDKRNTAWFHREATTLAHVLRLHEESYRAPDIIENTRRRRLYWLLFVTELRSALSATDPTRLPTLDEDPSETVELSGFIHLVNLFRPFDDICGLVEQSRKGVRHELSRNCRNGFQMPSQRICRAWRARQWICDAPSSG